MTTEPLIIERTYPVPALRVWKAISDKNEMKQWYFDLEEFKAVPGFVFSFMGGPSPEKQYKHICQVTEVISNQKLSYSWRFEGYEGNSVVTFELFEGGGTTRLKLTHAGLETFPADNPDFRKENFVTGWTELLGSSLKEYLEKAKVVS